jgi:hypothetical protein
MDEHPRISSWRGAPAGVPEAGNAAEQSGALDDLQVLQGFDVKSEYVFVSLGRRWR